MAPPPGRPVHREGEGGGGEDRRRGKERERGGNKEKRGKGDERGEKGESEKGAGGVTISPSSSPVAVKDRRLVLVGVLVEEHSGSSSMVVVCVAV